MDNLAKALSELLEQIECLRDIEFSLDVEPYKAEANWDDAVRRAQDALLQAEGGTPMTPRLVELVRRIREYLDGNSPLAHIHPEPFLHTIADQLDELSRLMAEGGLVGAGAAPLEEEESQMRELLAAEMNKIREPDQKKITAAMFEASVYGPYIAAMRAWGLLQRSEATGSPSNPVDDGAVERAYTALKQFYVLDGRVTLGHARAALEAAGPHP